MIGVPNVLFYYLFSATWVINLQEVDKIDLQLDFLENDTSSLYKKSMIDQDLFEDIKDKCNAIRKEHIRDYRYTLLAAFCLSIIIEACYGYNMTDALLKLAMGTI